MNRQEAVEAIVWLDALAAQARTEAAKYRADLLADARAEFEEQGTAPTWRIPDVATVAASVSHASVYVCDETAFTRWVAARYPTEVETIERVRAAWQAGFLVRALGSVGIVNDPETGEVVPGLAIRPGGQFAGVSIRPTAAAKEVFTALADAGLRQLAASASPNVPVVLAELGPGLEPALDEDGGQ